MSDEPGSKNDGEWRMPDPVFRSSDGFDPREKLKEDDIPTESPDRAETDEMDIEFSSDAQSTDAEPVVPREEPPAAGSIQPDAPPAHQGGGCFQTVGIIGSIAAIAVVLVIAGLVYFLFFYQPAQTTF